MPKVTQKGKLNDKSRSRVSDMLISLLATPFNLLFIGLKIIWSGRRLRLAAIALVMIAVAAAVFRVESFSPLADMLRGETYKATASAGFRVNDITVEGRKRTQRDDLLAAVNIRQNDPIFAVDLPEMHSRIEALPWVERATVLRRLPNIIHIDLHEREPFGFFKSGKNLALIDDKGVTITRDHLGTFRSLAGLFRQGGGIARREFHGNVASLSGIEKPHGGSALE